LAGLKPAAVICEIMREDGEMARRAELEEFCRKHALKMCTIAELISYRLKREQFVKRIESVTLPTRWGAFRLHAYQSAVDPQPHLALCKGDVGEEENLQFAICNLQLTEKQETAIANRKLQIENPGE